MSWLTPYLAAAFERWSDRGRYGWACFPPRNFRLESRLGAQRQAEYLTHVGEPFDHEAWRTSHRDYDLRHVAAVDSHPRRILQRRDRDEWPSPFRWGDASVDLAQDVHLVHLTSAFSLSAATPGTTTSDVVDAIHDRDEGFLEDVLENWWRGGSRTIYAALAADVAEIVDDARTGGSSWPNVAQDRLGLVNYDPLRDPIDVVLFVYRVADIPRAEGLRDKRPIAAPTAMDSGLNNAFCPVPAVGIPGRCVDLATRLETPVREIIHPRPLLGPKHVVAAGRMEAADHDLPEARLGHLEWIRTELGPNYYAADTDVDLGA